MTFYSIFAGQKCILVKIIRDVKGDFPYREVLFFLFMNIYREIESVSCHKYNNNIQ